MPGRTAFVALFGNCVVGSASLLGRPDSTLRVVVLVMAVQTFIHRGGDHPHAGDQTRHRWPQRVGRASAVRSSSLGDTNQRLATAS